VLNSYSEDAGKHRQLGKLKVRSVDKGRLGRKEARSGTHLRVV